MDNMSAIEYKALAGDDDGRDGFAGGGFMWVILIFLFFLGFSGNGLGGNRDSNNLAQVERDVLTSSCGTQKEVLESRFTTQMGFANAASQQAQCCCDTKIAIHAEGEATRALIQSNTIQELRDNLQAAQLTLANAAQTTAIVNALRPFPSPAYLTCSPYTAMNGFGNNGCGGCGCN